MRAQLYLLMSHVLVIIYMVITTASGSSINIAVDKPTAEVEKYFLSYAVDASILGFSQPRWGKFDFKSAKLRSLMKGLQPALFRFGGTSADFTLFADDTKAQDHLNATGAKPMKYAFTKSDVDNIMDLTQATGSRFLFDLDLLLRYGNEWDPSNAQSMMAYMQAKGYGQNVDFELGNEPDLYGKNDYVSPEQIGKDFTMMVKLVRSFNNFNGSMIVGPDTGGLSGKAVQMIQSVLNNAGSEMKAATFHHYYFKGPGASVQEYLDVAHFGSLEIHIKEMQRAVADSHSPGTDIWLGESADAYDSGTPNVSDRFVSGFLWLDKLGTCARMGVKVAVRQTLYGYNHANNYALLDVNMDPNPDYWLSAFHKSLVGQKVLEVSKTGGIYSTRVYAHCQLNGRKGAIVVFALNVNSSSDVITIDQFKGQEAKAYFMTAPNNDPVSKDVMVNGQIMKLIKKDGKYTPVAVKPKSIDAGKITVPPLSYGFFLIDDAQAPACM